MNLSKYIGVLLMMSSATLAGVAIGCGGPEQRQAIVGKGRQNKGEGKVPTKPAAQGEDLQKLVAKDKDIKSEIKAVQEKLFPEEDKIELKLSEGTYHLHELYVYTLQEGTEGSIEALDIENITLSDADLNLSDSFSGLATKSYKVEKKLRLPFMAATQLQVTKGNEIDVDRQDEWPFEMVLTPNGAAAIQSLSSIPTGALRLTSLLQQEKLPEDTTLTLDSGAEKDDATDLVRVLIDQKTGPSFRSIVLTYKKAKTGEEQPQGSTSEAEVSEQNKTTPEAPPKPENEEPEESEAPDGSQNPEDPTSPSDLAGDSDASSTSEGPREL